MKYHNLIGSFLLACLLLGGWLATAEAAQNNRYDVTIVAIEWQPAAVYANEQVVFAVRYARGGSTDAQPYASASIRLDVVPLASRVATETGETAAQTLAFAGTFCSRTEEAPGALRLGANTDNVHRFAPCFIPTAGEFMVQATLIIDGRPMLEASHSTALSVGPEQSALPNEIGRLFAGLGMFAAVMLIVAMGTEVLIDSLKVLLGMKSKVTTLQAVSQMENLLPGKLAALGATVDTQAQFQQLAQSLNHTLQGTLKPLDGLARIREALLAGAFGSLYQAFLELENEVAGGQATEGKIARLKDRAKVALRQTLQQLQQRVGLSDGLKERVRQSLEDQIDRVTVQDAANVTAFLVAKLSGPEWPAALVDDWLQAQRNELLTSGREAVLAGFDADLRPLLEGFGLQPDLVAAARGQVDLALSSVNVKLKGATDRYLEALENLLNSVEARRYAMQSPVRKLWRRLRRSEYGVFVVAFLAGLPAILVPLLLRAFLCLRLGWLCDRWLGPVSLFLVYYLLGLGIVWGIIALFVRLGKAYLGHRAAGMTSQQIMETTWNRLRGQTEIDPDSFDRPPTLWEVLTNQRGATGRLTVENVARIMLARSDQQRDEEASRQRWLRVISVGVGLALAYLLQVDAAVLLDAAVPGVSEIINSIFNFDGERLHAYWPRLSADLRFTAGMVLTGLAASAGSAFWHDQLEKLQATRKGAEAAAKVIQQAQSVIEPRDRP